MVVDDTIYISAGDPGSSDGFGTDLTTGAPIMPDQFVIGSAARDANDRFIYNPTTGVLFFDFDGTGEFEQGQLASLSPGLAMTNADIIIV